MTPKERASNLAKDMVHAYEVGATMKDLDGIVRAWTKQAERALTAAIEEEREACAKIADELNAEMGPKANGNYAAMTIAENIRARGKKQ